MPATAYHDLAPRYVVEIGSAELSEAIQPFISRVEYESADGMADMAKIVVNNPDYKLQDLKVWQPGNEMSIWLGYGSQLTHIGRVILRRARWNFPDSDMPSVTVSGYTYDAKMMDAEPDKPKDRRFKDMKYSDIVAAVATRDYYYDKLEIDIDDTEDEPKNRHQKAGISDYQVLKGCANLTGYYLWIDGDENGVWTLHFKKPENVLDAVDQPDLTFRHNNGDLTSLFSFTPELLIQGAKTKLQVQFKHPKTGKVVTQEVEEDLDSPDVTATDDTSEVDAEHKAASPIKIFFQDFSFTTETRKRFKTAAEAKAWAVAWFKSQREAFITGQGITIGHDHLRARQIHTLEGIGTTLSGRWYFSRVKHQLSESDGYMCTFNARKQESA
jgi:phage protein D